MEQRTDAWFAQRLGKVTASRIGDLMATTRTGPAASRKNYLAQLLCERLTGKKEEGFTSAVMQRGIDLESVARAFYVLETGNDVTETGFIDHPVIPMAGASPDGLVEKDGLIEIKCPNTWTHLQTRKTLKPERAYLLQMQWQMACTGRKWCDFVSFDDRLPENLQYLCLHIARDDELIAQIEAAVREFLNELDAEITALEQ